jgi:hypothetical protein
MESAANYTYTVMSSDGYCLYNCLLKYSHFLPNEPKITTPEQLKKNLKTFIVENWENPSGYAETTFGELVGIEHDYTWENIQDVIIQEHEFTEKEKTNSVKRMFDLLYDIKSDISKKELRKELSRIYNNNKDFLIEELETDFIGDIWAGLPEIIAFSNLTQHSIEIYQLIKVDNGKEKEARFIRSKPVKDSVLKLYSKYGDYTKSIKLVFRNGNHYDLIN